MRISTAALGIALLALPFHPLWLDFEEVRRGWLFCLLGLLLLIRPREQVGPLRPPEALLLALAGLALLRALPELLHVDWRTLHRVLWWLSLFCLLRAGRLLPWTDWARAAAPTTLAVSAYGVLQAFGLDPVPYYSNAWQPVSTLGNLNVASEVVAVLAAACAAASVDRRSVVLLVSVLLGAVYLRLNGSFSGQVALPLALSVLLLRRGPWRARLAPMALCAAGFLLATALQPLRPAQPAQDAPSHEPERPGPASPLGARPHIWSSALAMAADAPLLGHGSGRFAVEYPRYRSEEEIEISSIGRRFPTKVGTVHDDYLEVMVENGIPGFLLWLVFLLAAARAAWRADRAALAPLIAFSALMVVRSPLFNAPAVAVTLLVLGGSTRDAPLATPRRSSMRGFARLLGAALFVTGGMIVIGFTLATPYQLQAARGETPRDPAPLDRALAWVPFAADLHFLRLQEWGSEPDPERAWRQAQPHVQALDRLVPHHPHEHAVIAELALAAGRTQQAQDILTRVLETDPGEPTARLLLSTIQAGKKRPTQALQVLYHGPMSPGLRQALPGHLTQLAELAQGLGDAEGTRVYRAEQVLLDAIQAVRDTDPEDERSLTTTNQKVLHAMDVWGRLGLLDDDVRPWVVAAAHYLDLEEPEQATSCGRFVREKELTVADWQLGLIGDLLSRLRGIAGFEKNGR